MVSLDSSRFFYISLPQCIQNGYFVQGVEFGLLVEFPYQKGGDDKGNVPTDALETHIVG